METTINTNLLRAKHDLLSRGDVTQLCAKLGITRQTYYNTIAGKTLKVPTLIAVCRELGVDPNDALSLPSF